jgi:geranylgeranyl diphosphate synthase type II
LQEEAAGLQLEDGLSEACRTSLLSGGKRLRPVLCSAVAELLHVQPQLLRPVCLALEFIHTSSLIHDDLPALDNDDFRRGQPSCHKRFGEGVALLAGDVLLIRAFGLIAEADALPEIRAEWGRLIGRCGVDLCNGQTLDLRLAGRAQPPADLSHPDKVLETLCFNKTAALFRAAVTAPAFCLGEAARKEVLPKLEEFGRQLGLLFQITDDLLDLQPTTLEASEGEMNYASHFGVEAAEQRADQALAAARTALQSFAGADFLLSLIEQVRHRKQ